MTYTLTCTAKQLAVIARACELFARHRMGQYDMVLSDWNVYPPRKAGDKIGVIDYYTTLSIEQQCRKLVEDVFGLESFKWRDHDGDVAFCLQRYIHKQFADENGGHGGTCCTCNRSDMTAGEPIVKIEKMASNEELPT